LLVGAATLAALLLVNGAEAQRVVLRGINQLSVAGGLSVTPAIRTDPNTGTGLKVTVGIADGGVATSKLADGSVTTPKLANGSVSAVKLGFNPATVDTTQTITGDKTIMSPNGLTVASTTSANTTRIGPGSSITGANGFANFFVHASTSSAPGLGANAGGVLFLNVGNGNGGVAFGDGANNSLSSVVGYVQPDGTYILGPSRTGTDPVQSNAWGSAVVFRGAPNAGFGTAGGENSDPLWMSRFNVGGNSSELRMVVGDDGGNVDAFVIGAMSGGSFNQTNPFVPTVRINAGGNIIAAGSITANGNPSDRRLKRDIQPLAGDTLEKVAHLRGVTYHWSDAYREVANFAYTDRPQIGVVAQEVEKEFPELVTTVGTGKSAYKTVAYDKLSAVLLESVKELREQNQQLQASNHRLEARLDRLEAAIRGGK
jgi:hypothetical protein